VSFYRTKRWSHSVPAYAPTTRAPANPAAVATAASRIAAIEADSGYATLLTDRDRDFIVSVKGQVANNRVPSDAQASWLARIEKRLIPANHSYFDASNSEHVAKRAYALQHYKATGYYSREVAAMEADAAYVPDFDVWERMWSNKFINAGFKRYSAGAKFGAGDMVKAKIWPDVISAKHDAVVVAAKWSCGSNNWVYELLVLSESHYSEKGINPEVAETHVSIDRAAIAAAKRAEKEAEKVAKAAEKARLKAEKEVAKVLAALNKPLAALNKPARKPRAKKSV